MNQFVPGSTEARNFGRRTSGIGNTMDRRRGGNEQDGTIPGPGTSARIGSVRKELRRAASNVRALEFAIGKEAQGAAVR